MVITLISSFNGIFGINGYSFISVITSIVTFAKICTFAILGLFAFFGVKITVFEHKKKESKEVNSTSKDEKIEVEIVEPNKED